MNNFSNNAHTDNLTGMITVAAVAITFGAAFLALAWKCCGKALNAMGHNPASAFVVSASAPLIGSTAEQSQQPQQP